MFCVASAFTYPTRTLAAPTHFDLMFIGLLPRARSLGGLAPTYVPTFRPTSPPKGSRRKRACLLPLARSIIAWGNARRGFRPVGAILWGYGCCQPN